MALGAALRDRARIIRTSGSGERVEGSVTRAETTSAEFRCMYDPGDAPENRSTGGVRLVERGATLLTGKRFLDGTPLELRHNDVVVIDSRRFGTLRFQVSGKPERIVKRTTWLGYLAPLQAVDRKGA